MRGIIYKLEAGDSPSCYIGKTTTKFGVRFSNHKMLFYRQTCHYSLKKLHGAGQLRATVLETIMQNEGEDPAAFKLRLSARELHFLRANPTAVNLFTVRGVDSAYDKQCRYCQRVLSSSMGRKSHEISRCPVRQEIKAFSAISPEIFY